MHVNKTNKRALIATLVLSLMTASHIAFAGVAQIRGKVVIPYSTGLFSSAPDASSNAAALHAAKLAAWDLYTARFNDAKMKIYLANKQKFTGNIDEFVKNLTVVDQQADAATHMLNVVVRADVNETAVDSILDSTSIASRQGTGSGSTLVFLFLAREATKAKAFDARVAQVTKTDSSKVSTEKAVDEDDTEATGSRSSDTEETTTGGSVERKRSQVTYEVTSPEDVTAAMSDVLDTSGFEVAAYDDVVANCGGVDRSSVMNEFSASDDMSGQTRRSVIAASRQCGASLFATGTIDVGVQDTDPVSGNKRVYVSVRGLVWDIRQRLPRMVASVGPVQFAGLGPDDTVATRNALSLASRAAAKTLVDQLNAKQIH
jgi:sRNA-binding regulator protein Hfq